MQAPNRWIYIIWYINIQDSTNSIYGLDLNKTQVDVHPIYKHLYNHKFHKQDYVKISNELFISKRFKICMDNNY